VSPCYRNLDYGSVSELTQSLKSAQPRKDGVNAMREDDEQRRSARKWNRSDFKCLRDERAAVEPREDLQIL
jgi:hypothetical protein